MSYSEQPANPLRDFRLWYLAQQGPPSHIVVAELLRREKLAEGKMVLMISKEDFEELFRVLRAQQIVIHLAQFHQWATFDICREKPCVNTKKLLNRLNEGKPDYTPYQVKP
jgi:hypothetical protein